MGGAAGERRTDAEGATSGLGFLFRVEKPWIYVGPGEPERLAWIPSAFYARAGLDVCVRTLRGWKMKTTQALMSEFGAALQFFEGFGENWHALEECLDYLDEWLPADVYVLVVERAEDLLADEPEALADFLTTVNLSGNWWAKPVAGNGRFDRHALPFHVLLNVSSDAADAEERIVQAAGSRSVDVRRSTPGASST